MSKEEKQEGEQVSAELATNVTDVKGERDLETVQWFRALNALREPGFSPYHPHHGTPVLGDLMLTSLTCTGTRCPCGTYTEVQAEL